MTWPVLASINTQALADNWGGEGIMAPGVGAAMPTFAHRAQTEIRLIRNNSGFTGSGSRLAEGPPK